MLIPGASEIHKSKLWATTLPAIHLTSLMGKSMAEALLPKLKRLVCHD